MLLRETKWPARAAEGGYKHGWCKEVSVGGVGICPRDFHTALGLSVANQGRHSRVHGVCCDLAVFTDWRP